MAPIVTYPPYNQPSVAPSPTVQPPRELLALRRPPPSTAPAPPARPSLAPPPKGYTRTLHAAPAAWPKTLKESVGSFSRQADPFGPVPAKESKEERAARIVREKDVSCGRRKDATYWSIEEAEASSQPPQWLAVERWHRDVPDNDGITLVVAHANGLQKELGAPLDPAVMVPIINDVWFLDDVHHGASVDLNAGKLASMYAWADCARDCLNFVKHVLPTAGGSYQMKWSDGVTAPPVIGVGHSIGGNAMVQAARAAPGCFSALLLLEPMVQVKMGNPIVQGALKRRSEWPSVKSAAESRTNPMFKTWDQDVFDLYLQTSLVPTGNGEEVTLATPKWAEAAIFSDPEGPQRGWDALPELRCPVGFVLGGDPMWLGGPKVVPEIPWRAPRSRNERIMAGGHLLPQERPAECADAAWRFFTTLAAGQWDATASKL
ncbi:uncharacterized protein COLE_04407 [Cutaneotrichosporon oleaginosum]|uniref:uncharacterized protein n=1 Tax=Cutaneotrichosporon oleaginosum TaxID=879819 RepID=UPI0013294B73|nr:hypothetical protein COLE_04407 [Cutaneotrichosporon oleaginosum]